MAGEVGKFIPSGLAMGIERNLSPVSDAMDEMAEIATKDFNSDISFGTNVLDKARSYTQSGLVSMKDNLNSSEMNILEKVIQALSSLNIVLDDGTILEISTRVGKDLHKMNNRQAR